jgi:hypothetical protein
MRLKIIFGSVAILLLFLMVVYPQSDIMPQSRHTDTPDVA